MKTFSKVSMALLIGLFIMFSAAAVFAESATDCSGDMCVGSYTGTGAAVNITLGWTPKVVIVSDPSTTSPTIMKWHNAMVAAHALKTKVTGTTPAVTYATTNGISTYAGAAPMSKLTGTVSTTAGSALLTGSSTLFSTEISVGDRINVNGQSFTIAYISSATSAVARTTANATATVPKYYLENGKTPGFTVGADSDIDVSGDTIMWEAYR